MRACNDLKFLDTYWEELKKVSLNIKRNLHIDIQNRDFKHVELGSGGWFTIVKFSDIKDSWTPEDIFKGDGAKLKILGEKLCHMIAKGDAPNIKPMLESICKGVIKKHTKPHKNSEGDFCGYGHFRLGAMAYTLTDLELKRLKEFFKIY